MRYFVFFMFLLLATIYTFSKEDIDFTILLLFLDIFFLFLI